MLSGSPSRSRGPGSNSRKKSASCSSKDRSPLGTILIGRWSESDCLDVGGGGAASWVDPGGVADREPRGRRRDRASCGLEEQAQVFRHVLGGACTARTLASTVAFRQIRSSSLGIVSSIWRGGRGSRGGDLVHDPRRSESPRNGLSPGQQLVEHHAQAEDVGSTIDPMSLAPACSGLM